MVLLLQCTRADLLRVIFQAGGKSVRASQDKETILYLAYKGLPFERGSSPASGGKAGVRKGFLESTLPNLDA